MSKKKYWKLTDYVAIRFLLEFTYDLKKKNEVEKKLPHSHSSFAFCSESGITENIKLSESEKFLPLQIHLQCH